MCSHSMLLPVAQQLLFLHFIGCVLVDAQPRARNKAVFGSNRRAAKTPGYHLSSVSNVNCSLTSISFKRCVLHAPPDNLWAPPLPASLQAVVAQALARSLRPQHPAGDGAAPRRAPPAASQPKRHMSRSRGSASATASPAAGVRGPPPCQ